MPDRDPDSQCPATGLPARGLLTTPPGGLQSAVAGLLIVAGWALSLAFASTAAAQSLPAPTLRHVAAGEGSLTVAWAAAGSAADVVGYDIRYIESSSTTKYNDASWTLQSDVWDGGNLIAVVEGLTNWTSYDVAVRARTSSLTSAWSSSISGLPADAGATVTGAVEVHSDVPVRANLSSSNDVDFYTFTVSTKSEYIIWTTGDTDTLGELTLASGASRTPIPVIHNNWGIEPGPDNFMMFGSIAAGTYFFRVSQGDQSASHTDLWQGTGPYTLHIHVSEDTTSRADARTVTLGSKTPGALKGVTFRIFEGDIIVPTGRADLDTFRLDLQTATTISAHLESPTADTLARIIDSSGNEIIRNEYGGLQPNGNHFALRASLAAGTYYIQLTSRFALTGEGPYFLTVSESPEPAPTRAAAENLPFHTVAGGTAARNSDALYRIEVPERTLIDLSGSSIIDEIVIELQEAGGDPIGVDIHRNVVELPFDSVHTFLLREFLDTGTYYLNVKFKNPGSTGPFLILLQPEHRYSRLTRQCPPGSLGISDPLHGCQWHLHNTGQRGGTAGEDINLGTAWATTKGAGITVAVVDEGIDFFHRDLRDNFALSTSASPFGDAAEELLKEETGHGTAVAGVIAARDNEVGVVGVAPRATISAYQAFSHEGRDLDLAGLIEAFSLYAADTSIRNHSWGPTRVTPDAPLPTALAAAMDASRSTGDGGRGTLQVHSANNEGAAGGNATYSRYLNHRSAVVVCGVDDLGKRYVHSNTGPNLWLCAPTRNDGRPGITTTIPLNRYRTDFSGTSASAPIVSGVAALVRAANRDLTWRDTKLILADSARAVSSNDSSWAEGAAKYSDPSQKYRYSHDFGFGAVDADRAVALARNWTLLPAETSVSGTQSTFSTLDDSQNSILESSIDISGAVSFVEHVEVTIDIDAGREFRDLEIELVSPSGAISTLSAPYQCPPHRLCGHLGTAVMSSSRHLGEDPNGSWTLRLTDTYRDSSVVNLHSWRLQIYGHGRVPPASLSVSPPSVTEGDPFTFTITLGQAPGAGNRVTVNFVTADGTATAGEDFTPVTLVGADAVSFGPTETSKTVTVNTLRGAAGHEEGPETLLAWISRATRYEGSQVLGTDLGMVPQTVTATIDDHPRDANQLWFEAAAPGVTKSGSQAQFIVRVSNPAASNITVPYATQIPNGTIDFYDLTVSAAETADFTSEASGTVTILSGETSAEFSVATTSDADSAYEFFQVTARGAAPAGTTWRPDARGGTTADMVIEPSGASGTIYVVATPLAPQEGETVTLSAHLAHGATASKRTDVSFAATGSGGATADDFQMDKDSLRIRGGSSHSGKATITIAADSDYDPGETITLAGTSDRNGDVKVPVIAIGNTTPLRVGLAFTDPDEDGKVAEGQSVGVTVSLSGALAAGETVDVVLRLPHDAPGTILGDATLLSAGGGETGFSVHSPLADVTRRHPQTNRDVTYQEMTVRFTGAGAQSGTLSLTLGDDGSAADLMLVIALRIASVTGTGLSAEVTAGPTGILLIEADTERVLIDPPTLEIAEGATAAYEVSLGSDPGGTVTVTVASDNENAATVNKSSLTFTSGGATVWSSPQTVTVTATADDDGFDNEATITHAVSGYGQVTAGPRVAVTVRDDDLAVYKVPSSWGLIPTGVTVGQSFRLVVATSETTEALAGEISSYDAFVESLVARGHDDIRAHARGFRAWLSTEDTDARDNTHTDPVGDGAGHTVYWLGTDTEVAGTNADLYEGWDASGPGRDENGDSVPADATAWWGSKTDGRKSVGRFVGADSAAIRLTDIGDPTDASSRKSGPTNEHRVLAISPLFTVEATPAVTIAADATTVTEGAAATFTLSASPAPSSDLPVVVRVAEDRGGAASFDFVAPEDQGPRTVTIPAGASSVSVTVPTVDDASDEPGALIFAFLDAAGPGYTLGFPTHAFMAVEDDDPDAGVTVTQSGGSTEVAENGGTDTYTVVLNSQPTDDVVVTVTSGTPFAAVLDKSGGTRGPVQTLVFTPAAWRTAQTVTVIGVPDNIDNDNDRRSSALLHEITSEDPLYDALADVTVTAAVTDDDGPPTIALSVSPPTVDEGDGATTITVTAALTGPRFDVDRAIAVSVSGSGATGVVGFDPVADFNLPVTARQGRGVGSFTLTPQSDDTVEGNETVTVAGSLAGVTVTSASVTLVDDDGASGVTVTQSGGSTEVAENGGTDTYTVVLNSRPSHDVSVRVTSGTATAATVNKSGGTRGPVQTLVFTPAAWRTAQTITVEGVDDAYDNDNDRRSSALLHEITSEDPLYDALADVTVTAAVTDDDGPPTIALSVSPSTVDEGDGAITITVTAALTGPRFDVDRAIAVSVSGSGAAGVVGFDPVAAFNLPVTARQGRGVGSFTLTPQSDDTVEGNETVTVAGSLAGVTVTSASVTLVDDDGAFGVTVTQSGGSTEVAENGGTDTYTVALRSQPTHSVVVTVTSQTPSAATVNKSGATKGPVQTLVFTPADWSTAQTITVEGVDDSTHTGERTAEITHTTASADPDYDLIAVSSVDVVVADDDPLPVATLVLSRPSINESGAGNSTLVTAMLDRPSHASTTLVVSAAAAAPAVAGDFEITDNRTLTIAAGSTTSSGVVRISAIDNYRDAPDKSVTVSATASGGGIADPADLTLTIIDDDVTPLASFAATYHAAGETAAQRSVTVRVTLTPAPNAATQVAFTVGGTATEGTDYTTLTRSVTVPMSGYADIAVAIRDDAAPEPVETIVVTLADSVGYSLGSNDSTTIDIVDDEGGGDLCDRCVQIKAGPAATEGGSATWTVYAVPPPASAMTVGVVILDTSLRIGFLLPQHKGLREVEIPAGHSSVVLSVPVHNDDIDEPDGAVTAKIVSAKVGGDAGLYSVHAGVGSASVEVSDDDPGSGPRVSVANAANKAPAGGTLEFRVTLDQASAGEVAMDYELGTFSQWLFPGEDFYDGEGALNGTLTFDAGETEKVIEVHISGDAFFEHNDRIYVGLANLVGDASFSESFATGRLTTR